MSSLLHLGPCLVDLDRRLLHGPEGDQDLTAIEVGLLGFLAERPGQTVPQPELLVAVWGYRPGLSSRAVAQTIWRLRKKLEANPEEPRYLITVHGQGLRLELDLPPLSLGDAPASTDGRLFLGRGPELSRVEALLRAGGGILTLRGPGGVGKTRLAGEVAARWRAGGAPVLSVSLAAARSREALLHAVATSLGLAAGSADLEHEGRRVGRALGWRRDVLLLLDNFEQLPPDAREEVGRWSAALPALPILVTSQVALGLPGEKVVAVEPLRPAVGQELLSRLIRQRRPELRLLPEDEQALHELSARLDHLPLALEMAARRVGSASPRELCARLDARFRLLREPEAADPRHATLEAAITWSWELLTRAEQHALTAATVLPAAFGLRVAEAVLGPASGEGEPPGWVTDELDSLEQKSLICREEDPRGGSRWSLLVSVRELVSRIGAPADRQGARERLIQWALHRAPTLLQALESQPTVPVELLAELPALSAAREAALEMAAVEAACRIGLALDPLSHGRLPSASRLRTLETLISAAEGSPTATTPVFGGLLRARAEVFREAGRFAASAADLHRAIPIHRERGDSLGLARALLTRGALAHSEASLEEARAYYEEALQLFTAHDHAAGSGMALMNLALATAVMSLPKAIPLYERALGQLRRTGLLRVELLVMSNLATDLKAAGRDQDARRIRVEALRRAETADLPSVEGTLCLNAGTDLLDDGDAKGAIELFRRATALLGAQGDHDRLALAWNNEAVALMSIGELEAADALLLRLRLDLSEAHPQRIAVATAVTGMLRCLQGRPAEGLLHIEAATGAPSNPHHAGPVAFALWAALLADEGRLPEARARFAEAERAEAEAPDVRAQLCLMSCSRHLLLAEARLGGVVEEALAHDSARRWAGERRAARGLTVSQSVVLQILEIRLERSLRQG